MFEEKTIANIELGQATRKPGWYNNFLWWCAGANRDVLRQCPTEWAKYAGIGGTIFSTACMAALSGGYAISTVFDNSILAVLFGLFWGFVIIFNLDRLIVNTMYSDGKVTISWQEFVSGLPRIIMAIFLGIVISTPLEMKIFEDRINSQLTLDNQERTNASWAKVNEGNQPLTSRRDALEKQLSEIEHRLAIAHEELKKEGEGSALSGKAGHGSIYKDKETNLKAIESERERWNEAHRAELEDLKDQIKRNTDKRNDDIEKGNKEDGFCVRYEAFSNVKRNNVALGVVSLVIMLLFIIIECAPTLMRMMVADGSYDAILEAEKHKYIVMSNKRISDLNDNVNTEVKISTQKNQQRLEAEVLANQELMEKIAKAQAELLQTAIEKWREEELVKINENPSAYIKSNSAS